MRKIAICLALVHVLCACGVALAAEPVPPKGTLVIIGGALRPDNAPVWERVVQLAGGQGARIAVFASAAASPERSGNKLAASLRAYGADAFVVPVAVRLPGIDYHAAADDPEIAAQVRSAGGAYFAGGDQSRITQALRHADGSNTLVLDALWDLYRNGGVIAGTSAGAAIMSSTMFYDAKPVLTTLKLGVSEGREIAPGLGFIGDDVFIDQHLLVRGRFARMLPAMLKKGYKLGLGIDENTAMFVGPNREVEVVGYKGALLLELGDASADRSDYFNVNNVKISYLDNGDRFNLGSRVITPSADKIEGRIDPGKPYFRGPLFNSDILGHTAVVDIMARLIDSDQTDAIGVAMGSPRDVQPELGFEFRFSRAGDSVGFQSATSEASSIYRLRLDIRPIQVRLPIYQYK